MSLTADPGAPIAQGKPRGYPSPSAGWRLLERRRDMFGKVIYECWWKRDEASGTEPAKEHYWELRDEDDVIDYAKFLRDSDSSKRGDQEFARQQGVILPSMLARSIREGWYADPDQWRKVMRDSDYSKLRTTDDRI